MLYSPWPTVGWVGKTDVVWACGPDIRVRESEGRFAVQIGWRSQRKDSDLCGNPIDSTICPHLAVALIGHHDLRSD